MSKYFYSVRENDTLPIIAQKFVNNPDRWPEIVQQNLSHYPTKLTNISGKITPVFTELTIGQRLFLPYSWLGVNSSREQINAIKEYGYSFDIYRFDSNPRIVYHDMPFDYLLVQKVFGCRNVNQWNQNPDNGQRVCNGQPGMYTYYGYDKRLRELWGANLDKNVVQINRRFGQDHPFQTLEMKAGDVVKVPANWPDYQQCGNDDFTDIDNISKYVIPLTEGTDVNTSVKLYLSRRNSVKNQFWTANRNQTDFTALDVSDFITRDRDSACKCCGGDDNTCNCQRFNDMSPFTGSLGSPDDTSGIQVVKVDLQNGELVLAGEGADVLTECANEAVKQIQADPAAYQDLLKKYGTDQAISEAVIKQCKELNKDLIKEQEDKNSNKKEASVWPQILLALGMVGIVGTVIVIAGKESSKK